jgi:hypothetical protein
MDRVNVEVHTPKFGPPDFSLTARELGQRLRPPGQGGRPSDIWEIVRLVNGKVSLNPQDVAQISGCNFVKALSICVDFGLEYFVAKDLQDNIENADKLRDKGLGNFFRWLLLRVQSHARQHYEQFITVIMAWEGDIKNDLMKTLPAYQKPTSLQELDIKNGIGALVADWVVELEYRLKHRAFDWEKLDYPHIEAEMKRVPGASIFMPMGFGLPPIPQRPASRRKITFPPCQPRK